MTIANILGTVFQWLGYTIYNTSPPVATAGQPIPLQSDINGNLLVSVAGTGTSSSLVESTDTAGGAVAIAPSAISWNRSASTGAQNVYALPADSANFPHTVGWQSGLAPLVVAPAGWKILNPSTGVLTGAGGSYLYGSGGSPVGETWDWVADVADQIYWAK